MNVTDNRPRLVVFSTLFPNQAQPQAGLFIRERMFRVARHLPLTVVSPVPWFPFQSIIRHWRPHFRPPVAAWEELDGVEVFHPKFFSVPGLLKGLDGFFIAIGAWSCLAALKKKERVDVLDAHFAYPDGYAATLLAAWLGVPCTITLRGTEARLARSRGFRRLLASALFRAQRVFSVSGSLALLAATLGLARERVRVIGNGVDLEKFTPIDRNAARQILGIPREAVVLVTVGALVERKGFHRVISSIERLASKVPNLHYLLVGGASPDGNIEGELHRQVARAGLSDRIHFLGLYAPEDLHVPLSAANLFVLATRNEGWANVILEAMACGLPVVTTDVGGNREVVSSPDLGIVVPFDDSAALDEAIFRGLKMEWDRAAIREYAIQNSWDERVKVLIDELTLVFKRGREGEGKQRAER